MKKYILYLATLLIAFTSCSDSEEIDIKYQVDVAISPESVISDFQEYKSGNFTLPDEYKIRIRSLIYDEHSQMVAVYEGLVNQYSQNYQFSTVLPNGNYTMITSTDVIKGGSLSNVQSSYWSFTQEKVLNEFTIIRENILDYMGQATLGLTQTELIVDGQSKSLKVAVKPITALITCHFTNIHQQKVSNGKILIPTYLDFSYYNDINKITRENDDWQFNTTSAETDKFRLTFIDLTDSYYDEKPGIYDLISILPSSTEFQGYAEFISSDGLKYYNETDGIKQKIETGKQYDFTFDLKAFTLVIDTKSKSVLNPTCYAKKSNKSRTFVKQEHYKVMNLLK